MFTTLNTTFLKCFFIYLVIGLILGTSSISYAAGEDFFLYPNGEMIKFGFTSAGYSDEWDWGYSQGKHEYGSHELLCGDFGAAIFFSGIYNNQPNWLETDFSYPNWNPNTAFTQVYIPEWQNQSYHRWDDPNNPIDGFDTAQSIVEIPNQLRVTIDYKLVYLGDSNYSPLGFIDTDGKPAFVKSERWVCLLTYAIENTRLDYADIEDLRFYQMLHSHPTGTESPAQFSTYSNNDYMDALTGYDQQNPDASFKYDITQWVTQTGHADWVSFSSTVAPNHYDSGTYPGHGYGEPTTGTHKRIVSESLNNQNSINADDAAGAMEWDLGILECGEENIKTLTLAVMCGSGPVIKCPIALAKTDDVPAGQTRVPGNYVTYTINYIYSGIDIGPVAACIVDELPSQIDRTDVLPSNDGFYDDVANTVTWDLGTISHGQSGSVIVRIKINEQAPSQGQITNKATVYTEQAGFVTVTENTPIGCWGKVKNITKNIWYCTIQDAINAASNNDLINVWPNTYTERPVIANKSVKIKAVDPNAANTILNPGNPGTTTVGVTFTNSPSSEFYGFTITGSYYAMKLSNSSPQIENCIIKNMTFGIDCQNGGNAKIKKCLFQSINNGGVQSLNSGYEISECIIENNGNWGLQCEYSTSAVKVSNCLIRNCGSSGIFGRASVMKIRNNIIWSTRCASTRAGINFMSEPAGCEIIGNTICYNTYCFNIGTSPLVRNCILWSNALAYSAGTYNIMYSCVKDGYGTPDKHNLSSDPCFIDPLNSNVLQRDYRLKAYSLCRDKGDKSYVQAGELDIDGEVRKWSTYADPNVDIGADEWVEKGTDLTSDGMVNFIDYSVLTGAWGSSSGGQNWNQLCDLYVDGTINNMDLGLFCEDWLWHAGYALSQEEIFGFAGIAGCDPPAQIAMQLISDNNTPDPNSDITVYVQSDVPLSSMGVYLEITGNAQITGAMNVDDCNQFGWDPGWWSEPDIDPNGASAGIYGLMWNDPNGPSGDVGYVTIHYNSGPVTVSVVENSTYDPNCQPVAFATDFIALGEGEQMMMGGGESMMQSIEEPVDTQTLVQWLENLWSTDEEIRNSMTQSEWLEFMQTVQNSQY